MSEVTNLVGSMMLKKKFDRLKDEEGKITVKNAKKILHASLISLKHPYVG